MKWLLLISTIVGVLPLAGWLRNNPNKIPLIWTFVGFLVIQQGPLHTYMAMISWAGEWSGYTHGAEISLLDLVCLAIYLSLPYDKRPLPFRFPMALYFGAVLLSAVQASVPITTLFYAWQLIRVFFFYVVVARACTNFRVAPALLKGMALGLLLATTEAMWERFGLGILRTHGGFSQENFFGVVSHFVVFPFFALFLAGERGLLPPVISLTAIIICVLTVSRGALALTAFGYAAIFVMSAVQKWTPRKAMIAIIGVIAAFVVIPMFTASLATRFGGGLEPSFLESDDTRVALARAASMIIADHPMGIGANHFVVVANTQGYYSRAGVTWSNFGAIVHNVYLLVAAETGYIGLITFVIVLLNPMVVAFSCAWRNRQDRRADLLWGLGISLFAVYLHSLYEWIFVTFEIQYIFAAAIGLIAGLAHQLQHRRAPRDMVGARKASPQSQ